MNTIFKYFFGKLLVTFQEAKEVLNNVDRDKGAALSIRIANPEDEVKGYSKRLITVAFNVCSEEGFSLNTYYSKKVLLPRMNGIVEELIIPFIEAGLDDRTIINVLNFMNSKPCTKGFEQDLIFVLPNIYTADNIVFTLPKNDFAYLPVVEEANSKAKLPNDDFIKAIEEIQKRLQDEDPDKGQMNKKKTH